MNEAQSHEVQEAQFGNRIRQVLNRDLQVDARVAERLESAREQALEHLRPEPRRAFVLEWVDNLLGRFGGWGGLSLRLLAPIAMLVIALGAVRAWQQKQRAAEIEEIDAQLLTGDLPIDAYLDHGFQSYLKKTGAER